MTALLSLQPDPAAPQQARRFVAEQLIGDELAEARDVAELLVSELVTNAVVHAASPVEVEVDAGADEIVVRVRDADTGPLVMRAGGGSELDEGGRGFLLVDRLAETWGTEHRGGRKTVWFRLPLSDEPADQSVTERPGTVPADAVELPTSRRRLRTLVLRPAL